MNRKGFTLIELLVVIAIIGILMTIASVILADSRQKSNIGAIKSQVAAITRLAEIYNTSNPLGYGGVPFAASNSFSDCSAALAGVLINGSVVTTMFNDPDIEIGAILSDLLNKRVSSGDIANTRCNLFPRNPLGSSRWLISIPYSSNPVASWCVDVNGSPRSISVTPGTTATACP